MTSDPYKPFGIGESIVMDDNDDRLFPPENVRLAEMVRALETNRDTLDLATLEAWKAGEAAVKAGELLDDDTYAVLLTAFEALLPSDPEIMFQRVAWMLREIHNCPHERFQTMTDAEKAAAQRCMDLQAEQQNPEESDFWLLVRAFRRVVPEGRFTKKDLGTMFEELHAKVGCPECKGVKTQDGKHCGGTFGRDPNQGCGWAL